MIVDCAHYAGGRRQNEGELTPERAAELAKAGGDQFVWIGLHEPGPGELGRLEKLFGLDELAVEDAHRAHQRPKIEDYDDSYFIVLRTAHYHEDAEEVHFGEIHLFTGPGYVITVRHGPGSELSTARARLESRPDLLKLGPSAAVWAILDKVVDDYAPVVDGIDDDNPAPTQRIYRLKREVIEFHRAVWPLLSPLDSLQRGAYSVIPEDMRRFFRDVHDHARRVDEQVNTQRELLTSVLEANLALVSVSQNEVVKKISAVAAIIAVPTFIASVYGMNFTHMPELGLRAGYPLALGAMALCVAALSVFFHRIRWL